jgi:hypothetical protein
MVMGRMNHLRPSVKTIKNELDGDNYQAKARDPFHAVPQWTMPESGPLDCFPGSDSA